MANLYPTAGCRIYIGGPMDLQNADFVAQDFDGESWVEIDGWTQMGAIGDTAALITTPIINRNRDVKQKGSANAGQMQNVFASLQNDEGQIALLAASQGANKSNYAFKIELNDAPASGPAPAPSIRYFAGLVMNAEEAGGDANTIRNLNATIEVNSNIVRVPATTGA